MITPKDAETLATKHLETYVSACGCRSAEDVSNVLLKMLSVTGYAIAAVAGPGTAIAMAESVAARLEKDGGAGASATVPGPKH